MSALSVSGKQWILDIASYYWHIPLSPDLITGFIWLLGGVGVILMISILLYPWRVVKIFFWSWLQSDTKAFISILAWAFAVVIIMCYFKEFTRILVIVASEILAYLDLLTLGYDRWQTVTILTVVSLTGFIVGFMLNMV